MRKQKLWKSVMAVFTCAALMLSEPFAYAAEQEVSAQEEIGSEFQIEDGVLVEYTGKATEVKVPDGVTSIGDFAFYWCRNLSSIELPEGVTSIGKSAFSYCDNLSSIELPEGVTSIGESAFSYCSNLSSIELPESITSIGNEAFTDCSSLSSIKLPESITSIEMSVFSGCSSLSSIELPEGVTSIGNRAFFGCSSLSGIELPEGVTSIGDWAFSYCSSLSSIELPENLTSIGKKAFISCNSLTSINVASQNSEYASYDGCLYNKELAHLICCPGGKSEVKLSDNLIWISIRDGAFAGCSSLTSINVASQNSKYASYDGCLYDKDLTHLICCPGGKSKVKLSDNLIIIGDNAFAGCSSLSSIELPEGVTSIGRDSFSKCSSLGSIELPEGVTSIGEWAFSYCSSLSSIELPEGITSIEDLAFRECSSLSSINLPDSVTSIGSSAFQGCSSLSSIELPEGVTSIGNGAFFDCSSLSSIELPESVTSIGDNVFANCSSLASINVASQNSEYASYDGCLYNKDLTHLICCPDGKSKVKLSDNLISIGDGAFAGCSSLSSIELPESVTSIEQSAFYGCSSLSSIELPESVTSIGGIAFADCNSLSSIVVPESVTSIGVWAFDGCSELLTIYCKEGSYVQQYAIDNEIKYEFIKTPAVTEAAVTEEAAKALSDAAVVTSKDGKVFDVELSVTPVKDTGAADLVNADKALKAAKMKAFAVLDLTLTVNGKRVSLIDEKICVNIPMDKIFADITADTVVSVYRIDNGQLSFLGTSKAAADKTITFATEHFSPYVFVPVEDAEALKDVKVVNYLGDIDPSASVDIKSADIGLKNNSDILFGDANSDGDVNSKDAVLIKKHLAGYTGLGIDVSAADVNADGKVDSKDAVKLLKKLAGYDVVLGEP